MLRGDLQTTPLADLLQRLSGAEATGCIYLLAAGEPYDAEEATITIREGAIYGVTLPSTSDALSTRLVATNRVSPADLAEAKLAQETELATWALADLLIHLGLADEREIQTITGEHAMADLTEISGWDAGSWRFRRSARLARNLPSALPVDEALVDIGIRRAQWRDLLPTILGADAVVSLAADPPEAVDAPDGEETSVEMDAEAYALLCGVDGGRTIAQLAKASGFTLLEAGGLVATLVRAGLVQVTREMSAEELLAAEIAEAEAEAEASEAGEDSSGHPNFRLHPAEEPSLDALAAAFTMGEGHLLPEDMQRGFSPTGNTWEDPSWITSDPLAAALARVSAALSEAMTEPEASADVAEELAPETDGVIEAVSEAPQFDAPTFEAPSFEAPSFEAPSFEAPSVEVPSVEAEAEDAETPDGDVVSIGSVDPAFVSELLIEDAFQDTTDEAASETFDDAEVEETPAPEHVEPFEDLVTPVFSDLLEPEHTDVEEQNDVEEWNQVDEPQANLAALVDVDGFAELAELAEAEPEQIEALEAESAEAETPESETFEAELTLEPEADAEPEPEPALEPVAEIVAEPVDAAEPEPEPEPEPQAAPQAQIPEQVAADLTPAGRADNAAQASRMLSQLAGDFASAASEPEEEEPEPEPEPAPAAPAGYTPTPRRQTGPADTAALLRELSSLGADNGGAPAPSPRPAPRPSAAPSSGQPSQQQRKRKGLFGRN